MYLDMGKIRDLFTLSVFFSVIPWTNFASFAVADDSCVLCLSWTSFEFSAWFSGRL